MRIKSKNLKLSVFTDAETFEFKNFDDYDTLYVSIFFLQSVVKS